ncbi:hypothetical protein [Shewanella sp. ALD9]|uniref:hypothetical protein n=1 Tax=Shewanella sp. ALD9 TaxID=2058330 RepID=UPI0012FEDFE1|nr:hypothetical protein [Shewanella sp. ALD9]
MKNIPTTRYQLTQNCSVAQSHHQKSKFLKHEACQLIWTRHRPSPTSDLRLANSA